MSDGTLRFLAIVTALLTRKRGSLLVIEEVDNGLHPSRAQVLIEMMRDLGEQRGIDVIVTTHNPALMDAAGARMIPFITVAHRDPTNGASHLTQLEDIEQLPKLIALAAWAGYRLRVALRSGSRRAMKCYLYWEQTTSLRSGTEKIDLTFILTSLKSYPE